MLLRQAVDGGCQKIGGRMNGFVPGFIRFAVFQAEVRTEVDDLAAGV